MKIWEPDGPVVYADEPQLIGRVPARRGEAGAVLGNPPTRAEVSDLQPPENRFEPGDGKLLEVYRPVWAPIGSPLLFEMYTAYDQVDSAQRRSSGVASPVSRSPACAAASSCCCRCSGGSSAGSRAAQASARAAPAPLGRRLRRGAPADRRDAARRSGAGPRRVVLRRRRCGRAGWRSRARPSSRGRALGGGRHRAHQHRRPAVAARRHLPAEPAPRRARGRAGRPGVDRCAPGGSTSMLDLAPRRSSWTRPASGSSSGSPRSACATSCATPAATAVTVPLYAATERRPCWRSSTTGPASTPGRPRPARRTGTSASGSWRDLASRLPVPSSRCASAPGAGYPLAAAGADRRDGRDHACCSSTTTRWCAPARRPAQTPPTI